MGFAWLVGLVSDEEFCPWASSRPNDVGIWTSFWHDPISLLQRSSHWQQDWFIHIENTQKTLLMASSIGNQQIARTYHFFLKDTYKESRTSVKFWLINFNCLGPNGILKKSNNPLDFIGGPRSPAATTSLGKSEPPGGAFQIYRGGHQLPRCSPWIGRLLVGCSSGGWRWYFRGWLSNDSWMMLRLNAWNIRTCIRPNWTELHRLWGGTDRACLFLPLLAVDFGIDVDDFRQTYVVTILIFRKALYFHPFSRSVVQRFLFHPYLGKWSNLPD